MAVGVQIAVVAPGTCRFCGCTDARACRPPCFWIDELRTVCSSRPCVDKYFGEHASRVRELMGVLQRELQGGGR